MQSFYYEAVMYDGDTYCLEHVPKNLSEKEIMPVFADSEWDNYPYCGKCLRIFKYINLLTIYQKGEN